MSSHTGSSSSSSPNSPQSPAGFRSFSFRLLLGLTLAALVTGVFSGLGAIALHYVLDFMQELTFGQAEGHHPMVTDGADPARRALVWRRWARLWRWCGITCSPVGGVWLA